MRILGVDLGNSSIKFVEIDSAFGRFEIHDYHEISHDPQGTPAQTVANWISNRSRKPDRVVVALASPQFTFRNIQMPTRDKKAIQASVAYELEDELPFAIENSAYQFVPLTQTKGGSLVHIAATLKDQIRSAIQPWTQTSIEPDVITTEAWAYRTLMNQVLSDPEKEGPTLLIQIGHFRTTFYLHWHGAPAMIRDFSFGGRDLTLAISQKFNVPIEQAEVTQINQGMIQSGAETGELPPEQAELSECLKAAFEPFINELRHINLTSRNYTRKSILKIYLSGGTSLLPGLGPWISQQFNIPTQKLPALSATATSGITYSEQTDSKFILAASMALCLVGQARNACINFRHGEFAKVSIVQKIDFKILKKPAMSLAAMTASLILSVSIQSFVYDSRLQTTNTVLEKSIKSFFGQITSATLKGYLAEPKKLKLALNKELTKQRDLSRLFGPNPKSPAAFLNQISMAIPKDLVVDLDKFQVGVSSTDSYTKTDALNSTQLTFTIANPQVAERLTSILSRKMNPIKRGDLEEFTPAGSEVKKWRVSYSGTPTEDAYGK